MTHHKYNIVIVCEVLFLLKLIQALNLYKWYKAIPVSKFYVGLLFSAKYFNVKFVRYGL